ncbi:hypothetical protein BFJ66_g10705 [Fusarium oxysporum f. sp. cepae]|uniref:Uncharacterized protein n=1 Tax=Fusarium oxysporum f. sp. cepae TaxID=396571 RepID=A0A3L6MSE3_FUSOX|nr:hypothetical protein BFJ65_g18104 [Fusarium oxysporum f. sp. cepae]RKK39680.1 hypothetical protein BFJ67_g11323 [Fusarium oxysporum f. sp. cepae]RKK42014.1 hypothetical protein BFJ66_g10705 [Fusarium oxysporum f. sp. cepae]
MSKYSDPTLLNQISTFSLLPSPSTPKLISSFTSSQHLTSNYNSHVHIDIASKTIMSIEPPPDHLEVLALRNRIQHVAEENKYVNDENDHLRETNGELALENDELKKGLALAEQRLERVTDFWRSAEEELTKQIAINEDLTKQLEAAKSELASTKQAPK